MSPNSAGRAEKLGYTNVKVYHEGLPEWSKKHYTVFSAQSLKEAFMDKDIPMVLLDVRPASIAEKGFIKGAISMQAPDMAKNLDKLPPRDKKPPIIIYDQNGGDNAKNAAMMLVAAGYGATVLTGGMDAWKASGFPVQKGTLATTIVYVPKPRPGEISVDDFEKIASAIPADTVILDVRDNNETEAGMIRGAKCIPDEEILDRLAEIPKNKKIIIHCSTGVRAEMAYHKLKEKGYDVKFLNAKIDIDKAGNFKLERS